MQERRTLTAVTRSRAISTTAIGVAVAVVVLDQLTKWWAINALDDRDIDIAWKLRLHLIFNRGAAFGLGSRYAPLFALAALTAVLLIFRQGGLFERRASQVGVGLVLGGAVGNLLDRVLRDGEGLLGGAVVDFIDVQFWPVWNVADMALTFGAVVLAITAGRDAADTS